MCGRYSIIKAEQELAYYYGEGNWPSYRGPSYNVAPSQNVPVMTADGPQIMRFGLVPRWAKSMSVGYTMINAVSETIFEKATYKKPIISKRCLVPASGYYEWKKLGSKETQPYYFYLPDRELFSFGGIYTERFDSEGQVMRSFAIITTKPNELGEEVHDRMPLILSKEEEALWLDPDLIDQERIMGLMDTYPASEMATYPVSKDVGSVKNNEHRLIEKLIA